MININKIFLIISIFLSSFLLSSCQEEQGRILNYKKAENLRKWDEKLFDKKLFLRPQVKLCSPSIVLCCYNFLNLL